MSLRPSMAFDNVTSASAADHAGSVPMPVRKERNRILRELAAAKNLAFRQSMVGRTLSAVTLHEDRAALSENYLKIRLAEAQEPNRIVGVKIGGLTDSGLSGEEAPTSPFGLPWPSIT